MNERELIEKYFLRPASGAAVAPEVVVGIGDDAAVLGGVKEGEQLVVTADTLVEDVHFPGHSQAEDVGHKALAVNLSDLAAMGATPHWATLCLSLPEKDGGQGERWVEGFSRGFFALANRWDVALVGGDLVHGPRTVTVQLGGAVAASKALLRSGAQPGEGIYLTGAIGDAGVAWHYLEKPAQAPDGFTACMARLYRPEPRVAEGRVISRFASAAMDVSDGLLGDLLRLVQASRVGAHVAIEKVPLGEGCRAVGWELGGSAEDRALPLIGGEDYELVFMMDDRRLPALTKALEDEGAPALIARIGQVTAGDGLRCTFEGADWSLPERLGFDHFGA